MQMVMRECGHFQFLDEQSMLDRAVCQVGRMSDSDVRLVSQAIMIAWGKLMVRERGGGGPRVGEVQVANQLQELELLLSKAITAQLGGAGAVSTPLLHFRSKGLQSFAVSALK